MNSTEKIILSGNLNKSSKDENMALNISLSGSKKILSDGDISNTVNIYDEYINERKNSNKFRLSININPFCSNVLFNPFTEIVKYDDNGDRSIFLNYADKNSNKHNDEYDGGITGITSAVGKEYKAGGGNTTYNFPWTAYKAIRDTQLSNDKCGFTYYCGIDIFNNHILRNKSFRGVNYSNEYSIIPISAYSEVYGEMGYKNILVQQYCEKKYRYLIGEDFNTIDDYLRDRNGVIISDLKLDKQPAEYSYDNTPEVRMPLHLYQKGDIYSFENCISEKLVEQNGWFGFINPALFDSLMFVDDETSIDVSVASDLEVSPVTISGCSGGNIVINYEAVEKKAKSGVTIDINKTINSKNYCDFIDMYPTRELFSFTPLYNEKKKRFEKNWNYYLTYPSKSITRDFFGHSFPFFKELLDGTIALNTVMFDEYTVDDDGRGVVTIYSVCQHGLKKGDSVNIYNGDKLVYNNGEVSKIIDKYIFQVIKEPNNISKRWINIDETFENGSTAEISVLNNNGETENITCTLENNSVVIDNVLYRITASNRCNIDPDAQEISFKRVFNNVECEYYVRVFSRLPNFKFANAEINDYNLYEFKDEDSESKLIKKFSEQDFENHISDISFSETSYGDKNTEILYTDDIDISFLKDNLGRPLSEIYFTIVKNNKGYKEWYSSGAYNLSMSNIEFSHCFGYNSSSFLFNDYYREAPKNGLFDVRDINAGKEENGLLYYLKNGEYTDEYNLDETRYYGDICCYCPVECDEYSLQSVMSRFNTVQREMALYGNDYNFKPELFNSIGASNEIGVMYHDEIIDDESGYLGTAWNSEFDLYNKFNIERDIFNFPRFHSSYRISTFDILDKSSYMYNNMLTFREGYYYKMHYRIPLKTVSETINKDDGIKYEIYSIEPTFSVPTNLRIKTVDKNGLSVNDKVILYNKTENKFYYLTVLSAFTEYHFECSVRNENLSDGFNDTINNSTDFSLVKRNIGTPEYARIIKDGSCTYYWRDIISNGIEQNDNNVYPFTNGTFYINKQINFFLRRQDPKKENLGLNVGDFDYVPEGESIAITDYYNQYYSSEEIESC